jgi:hypothetical protein
LGTCSSRRVLQIGNHTIKLSMLNKDSKWTKALKLMLANLKVRQKSRSAEYSHPVPAAAKQPLLALHCVADLPTHW